MLPFDGLSGKRIHIYKSSEFFSKSFCDAPSDPGLRQSEDREQPWVPGTFRSFCLTVVLTDSRLNSDLESRKCLLLSADSAEPGDQGPINVMEISVGLKLTCVFLKCNNRRCLMNQLKENTRSTGLV